MTLFEIPTGTRVNITTGKVNIEMPEIRAAGVVGWNLTYDATATDRFQEFMGKRRRLFVDASVEFPAGGREIWLENNGPETDELEFAWPNELQEVQ